MKKLLLILLCLPMMFSCGIENNKNLEIPDFGFEHADSQMGLSYYVHYYKPKLIGWSENGKIAYSYTQEHTEDGYELGEQIVIQSMITDEKIVSIWISDSDGDSEEKIELLLSQHNIDGKGLGNLHKTAYVDEFKIVFDKEELLIQGGEIEDWMCHKIISSNLEGNIYFSGYFKSPYENRIAIGLIHYYTFEEEDYFTINFFGCDLNKDSFDCK